MQAVKIAFVALLGAVLAADNFTEEQYKLAKNLADACHAELGGDLPENFGTRIGHELFDLPSEASKCNVHCIFHKLGTVNEDGTTNREGLLKQLTKGHSVEKAEALADLCVKENEGETKCQRAYSLYQCYHKNKSLLGQSAKA